MKNNSPAVETEFLTPAELAKRLRVSPITLRSWADRGLIQCQTTLGGHRRYPQSEVERLLHGNKQRGSSRLRILVVDDDPFIAAVLEEFLCSESASIVVETAGDGFAAGRKLVSFMPDIVLLDLMMPGLDGFEVCRQIKNDPVTAPIRVIAITGYPTEENVRDVLDAGAEACLAKPVDTGELLAALNYAKHI